MLKPELKPAVSRVGWLAAARMIAAGLVIGYALVLATFAREGFPTSLATGSWFPFLSDQPVGEDGYYLMMVAWNLGAGQGMTANFGETVTGVQPLLTWLLAAVAHVLQAMGGDKFDLARAVIVLGGFNVALLAAVAARIARRMARKDGDAEIAATAAFIMICFSAYLFRTATYGLETGLYLLLFAITIDVSLRPFSMRRALGVGVLIGLTGLARIDFGIVAALAFVVLLLQGRINLWRAVLAGLVALAITAPWFIWVHSVSGAYMPSSGPAQSALVDASSAPGRAEAMASAVLQNLAPWLPASGSLLAGLAGLAALIILFAWARRRAFDRQLAPWWAGVASLPPIYFALFWAGHFYARYTAPILVLSSVATACAFASVPARWRPRAIAALFVIALPLNAHALWRAHHSGGIGDGHAVTAGYVAREIKTNARVGAFQSGVTGYYNANVINLDGKVNQAALVAMREKRVEEYLDAARIDYVLDWEGVINGLMPRAMASGQWIRCPKPVGNRETICVMRRRE